MRKTERLDGQRVRGMIDEMFKDTHDNWWTATRPDIHNTQDFKTQFRAKYWSESTQNVVRNDISNGRYESQSGQSLTSYFFGKVCMARNLEPVSYTHLDVYKRQR